MSETGRYVIIAHLVLPCYPEWQRKPRRFPSVFLRDEYQGWNEFHCSFLGGAMALYIRPEGKRWLSKDEKWAIDSVQMITRDQYMKELDALRVPTQEQTEPGRQEGRASTR